MTPAAGFRALRIGNSNSWRPATDMPSAHTDYVAVLLGSGQVLVPGGGDRAGTGITLTSEVLDPGSGNWQSTGYLMAPVTRGAAALLADGRVLLVGSGAPETPDTSKCTWAAAGPMHFMWPRHAAVPLPSGAVLVTGGIQTGQSNGIPNQARAAISEGEVYRP